MRNIEDVKAPVLLITFNRPDNTRKVLEQIKLAKIKNLYIANDAPREGNKEDVKARNEIILMIKEIDWDCEVHTMFQEKNLGCGKGVESAISWAFSQEEKLIILEDDCVPALSFFTFCDEMLDLYANDTRIGQISGRSHQSKRYRKFKKQDYVFTHYAHIWGWATWKRCWNQFDILMTDYPDFINSSGAINVLLSREQGELLNRIQSVFFENIEKNQFRTWDYQWGYTLTKNGALSIVPSKNLVKNIGFVGTHINGHIEFDDMESEENFEVINHPKFILADSEYELLHFKTHIKKRWGKVPIYIRAYQKILRTIKL